jgi:hypothetical protein
MWPFSRPEVVDGHYIGDTTPSVRVTPPPSPPRSIPTMTKDQLTDADMADHRIAFRRPGLVPKTIRAAYVMSEDKHPDMLVFKDSEHRTVYMVSRDETLEVERLERSELEARVTITECADGRRTPFVPTSEALQRAGIKPEDFR